MWSKIFILALAVIPFQAPAHEGEPSPPYEVKDATRFYLTRFRGRSAPENLNNA